MLKKYEVSIFDPDTFAIPQETIGEILKTCKNEFDWLKTIFFMKEGIRDHFLKVSSDLKPF